MERSLKDMKKEGVSGGNVIYLISNNTSKFFEIRDILNKYGLSTALLRFKDPEIQSERIEEIAEVGARTAAKKLGLPVVVEDAGLFIEALDGFPGPYSSYVYKTIGNEGILKLMDGVEERRAVFKSTVAYAESPAKIRLFTGKAEGRISLKKAGEGGFGFDPIFIPEGKEGRTFAELTPKEKNLLSHRGSAFRGFAEWYTSFHKLRFK